MIGRVLDRRYRITARIARGGMASVYEAHDERLDRTVAIKVMHPGMGDDATFAARFVREARAAARLSHPHVVAVYDQGTDDGTVFLAMELVPGHTLRDVIAAEAPLPPARALAQLEPVLSALSAAHKAGLVHRDVKPENVLISDDGRTKVADFGLARAVTAETQHTSTGVLIGTVSYIAPELVVEGRSDARADVYAAGVMLYELLTGVKPHTGESPIQVAYKHVHEDVPPPSERVSVPAYVDALVARATARDASLRPADAGVFLRQVRMVAGALADGVVDDPELVADLLPPVTGRTARPEPTIAAPVPAWVAMDDAGDATTALRTAPASAGSGDTAETRVRPIQPAAQPPRRRRRRLLPLIVAVLVLALAAAAVVLERDHIPFLDRVTVPGISNDSRAEATSALQQLGLTVVIGTPAYSDTVHAGRALTTDPGPGATTHKGDTITLVMSKGVEQYSLPDVRSMPAADAQAALTKIKMDVTVRRVWSEAVDRGEAVGTDPRSGTVLRPAHPVTLLVSKGPRPITTANWVRRSAARAEARLTQQGLHVNTVSQYSDSVPSRHVIAQDPGPEHVFHRGDTVTLTVSKGPELVKVPSVRGEGTDAATQDLQAAGFKVEVDHYSIFFGLGIVMEEAHDGEMMPRGSTIAIYVS